MSSDSMVVINIFNNMRNKTNFQTYIYCKICYFKVPLNQVTTSLSDEVLTGKRDLCVAIVFYEIYPNFFFVYVYSYRNLPCGVPYEIAFMQLQILSTRF